MPVFISHRSADDAIAQRLAVRLKSKNVPCYLDDFDPRLGNESRVTSILVDAINRCTHLLALVTNETQGSWWVPFEIGVARQAPRRISTFDHSTNHLPGYLREWPVLHSDSDLDKFADTYHRDVAGRPLVERYSKAYQNITTPADFHRELKAALGQR